MLREGQTFGPYLIRQRLGAGGMGEVYLAFDSRLRRDVALKVLPVETATVPPVGDLIREARLASALSHQNICTVFEAGEIDGLGFIAMERVEGQPLSEVLKQGPLASERVLRIGAQMAAGLAHAHAQGVVHCDLKSANVFVGPDGRVRIVDFGLSIRIPSAEFSQATGPTESVSSDATVGGTVPYMAPELLRGSGAGVKSDIWAFGVVLFELIVGVRPFGGHTQYEVTSAILLTPTPALPPGIPDGLAAIIGKCLAKEPGERYQQMGEVKAALEAVSATRRPAAPGRHRRLKLPAAVGAALLAVAAVAGIASWRSRVPAATARKTYRTIAVLPLTNLSQDAAQDLLADGMTEALITDLARIKGIDVISRTSVMQYKNARKPLPQIARELTVDAVLEGSVLRVGDRVRITAQLIEASTDRHLWADDYDRDVRDILALQREVARAVARQVRVTLSPQDEAPLTAATPRIEPAAHDAYLQGRALLGRLTEPAIAAAIEQFETAVRIEPAFATAWAWLGSAHAERGIWGVVAPRESGQRAHAAVAHALALDPDNADALAVLGQVSMMYDWEWAAAERACRRAIDISGGPSRIRMLYAALLQATRRFPEGVAQAEAAVRLDPASAVTQSSLARALYRDRQFDRALEVFRRSIQLDPGYLPNYARVADVFMSQGNAAEALVSLERGDAIGGHDRRRGDGFGVAYALAGRRAEALQIAEGFKRDTARLGQNAYSIAFVETALGNHAEAIRWLNRAYDERSANMWLVDSEPKFEALREEPGFQALLQRLRLPR
jgi:TolB-like protein/cytochrome c-type biogenesis protein CcmH/NrfG